MVVGLGLNGDRIESRRRRLVVPQPGARRGLVEDLHDWRAKAAREPAVATERVSPATLLCLCAVVPGGGTSPPAAGDARRRVARRQHIGRPVDLRIDLIAPRTPRRALAAAASSVSGLTPVTTRINLSGARLPRHHRSAPGLESSLAVGLCPTDLPGRKR